MGAGCSSPLRRFGGKKIKTTNRDSVSVDNNDNLDQLTIAARLQQQPELQQHQEQQQHDCSKTATDQLDTKQARLNLENEITIQSEAADDHPSSASYYTDGRTQVDENNKSSNAEQQQADPRVNPQLAKKQLDSGQATTRMMGLGNFGQHDRHLLVSPALSPAPSICQSPAPNNSFIGSSISLDLGDLNEAFKMLTFGLSDNHSQQQRIKQPDRLQSEITNLYAHQLVQNHGDLTNFITAILITTEDSFSTLDNENSPGKSNTSASASNLNETITKQIEIQLRSICDDHSYNLRFLDLSYERLTQSMFVNNLPDVAMNIFEQEYKNNSERFIVIMLANGSSCVSFSGSSDKDPSVTSSGTTLKRNGKRLLPTKIEAQLMHRLLESGLAQRAKDLLKSWYNQVGNIFYLRPLYSIDPDVLVGTKEVVPKVWQNWLQESFELVEALITICENDIELGKHLSLRSLSSLFVEFILKESQLQKRTLLIRNYPQNNNMIPNQQHQLVTTTSQSMYKSSFSELARHLADPNKLTLKRPFVDQELAKTIGDWVMENFNKYIECFLENRITQGKFAPPFVEKKLFIELTEQRHLLEFHLDNITESFELKCRNFYRNQVRPILTKFLENSTNTSSDINVVPSNVALRNSEQSLASSPSANHLVLISGPKGCGKTTLLSQIIKHTAQDLFSKVQIIYRYCGITVDTLSPNRLLRSICEQFCQVQGENTTAATYIYSCRKDVMNSLNKSIKQQNCILFLDGINSFDQSCESDLDWLCDLEAEGRVKIFIMLETNSPFYKKALSSYTDAIHISLDNATISEWAQMLTYTAKSRRLSSATNLYDDIKNLSSNEAEEASTVSYRDVSDTLSMCQIRRLNNEHIYPELNASKSKQSNPTIADYKNIIHNGVLKHLHYLLAPHQLCAFLLVIDSSRNGLCENNLIEIMDTMISQLQQKYPDTRQLRFTSSMLSYLKIQLRPWLRFIVCDKVVKLTFQKDFLSKAIEYYVPNKYPKLKSEVLEILLDYFNRPFKQCRQKNSSKSGSDQTSRSNISRAEAIWLDTQISETTNLLILTNPTKAREYLMNKDNFYQQFLYRSYPEEYLEDYDRLKLIPARKASQTNEDLSKMVNFIRQSIFPLRYDGSQIYSQIYCRSYDSNKSSSAKSRSKKFNEIIAQASCPPIKNLFPVSSSSIDSFIKTRIGLNAPPSATTSSMSITSAQSTSGTAQHKGSAALPSAQSNQKPPYGPPFPAQQQRGKQKIFTIDENHRHVIVIYPDKNCLSVWDIFEEKAVRTINNIDQPRDLRMVDQKRAVVLCNRELRVYDLDSGELMTKLKGVMNQKMPYFEVFGQDYVIALARNRMYVNMLNLNTGELETTFKVGEDRFLNSLLVSANGGICVCGDETQKPFPLLVWNLNERRLMYDLRLDRHEFITRMSAISNDGHFVVSVCRQLGGGTIDGTSSASSSSTPPTSSSDVTSGKSSTPNFIVIYDLNSGTLFKKWKPSLDTCAVAISISANRSGKVMNAILDNTILVWDLATGSKRHTLVGHSAPTDVMTVQNNRLFSMDSTCHDQSLRIWDIEEGYCLAVFSPDAPVSCCQLSTRGDALVCGFVSETRLSTLVVCQNETVTDIVKRNKRRKSSRSSYLFDESPTGRKQSSG